jgi:lipopolysaccharide assembly protein A
MEGGQLGASPTVARRDAVARRLEGDNGVRYVYILLVVAFTILVVAFTGQNLQNATVSFLSWSVTLPVSIVALLFYGLGMLTGGFLLACLRSWIRGATPGSR